MSETIDLTPRGMTTTEGCQRVNKAQNSLQAATATFANACAEFLENWRDDLIALKGYMDRTDREAFGEELHQIEALRGGWQRASEEFLRSVAGVPPAL